jgi:hypothetical protein
MGLLILVNRHSANTAQKSSWNYSALALQIPVIYLQSQLPLSPCRPVVHWLPTNYELHGKQTSFRGSVQRALARIV